MVIALDPGKNIGLAVVDEKGRLLEHKILTLTQLKTYAFLNSVILLGDGTGAELIGAVLKERGLVYSLIDETGTSLEARKLYLDANPAKGLWRLVPKGLRSPSELIDDYAAYAIALKFLTNKKPGEKPG